MPKTHVFIITKIWGFPPGNRRQASNLHDGKCMVFVVLLETKLTFNWSHNFDAFLYRIIIIIVNLKLVKIIYFSAAL